MADATQVIDVDKDDVFHVSVSAHIQSFRYVIFRYLPDGKGGFQDGQQIGSGDNAHSQWLGKGSEIEGARIEVCVTHGGNTASSQFEIVVRLVVERSAQVMEDVGTWRIRPGLASGDYSCMMLQFK